MKGLKVSRYAAHEQSSVERINMYKLIRDFLWYSYNEELVSREQIEATEGEEELGPHASLKLAADWAQRSELSQCLNDVSGLSVSQKGIYAHVLYGLPIIYIPILSHSQSRSQIQRVFGNCGKDNLRLSSNSWSATKLISTIWYSPLRRSVPCVTFIAAWWVMGWLAIYCLDWADV